ncbi:MAG: hypothetical protein HC821_05065 [Lewinella sp.]|nr:hypothetical protein [Lewinella sp.]
MALLYCTTACIGDDVIDDFVVAQLRIDNPIDSLSIDSTHQLQVRYFNNIGREEPISASWISMDPTVATVTADGKVTARAWGSATILARFTTPRGEALEASTTLHTALNPVPVVVAPSSRRGTIRTTSSYLLTGSFTLTEADNGDLRLDIGADYRASTALPDLFLYLSNNPNSISGALTVADVMVFSGAHSYTIPNVRIGDYSHLLYYCRPFNVKVGDGRILE